MGSHPAVRALRYCPSSPETCVRHVRQPFSVMPSSAAAQLLWGANRDVVARCAVIERQSLIDASKPEGTRPAGDVHGEVALQSVNFSYPTRPDVPVFRNFSLVAPAGRMTALVGESGSGKSTIVNLVERFYDVDSGAVMLDGRNVKELDITWLRAQVWGQRLRGQGGVHAAAPSGPPGGHA